ncbi:MAG: WecB/TagA/CpsF family glycosyltransferase [Leptolyngbya sp. SIO4C1]|nr:WecB/TagA/CpsF family glycosyltransferase [Leptolyngbya sp. SIO4C1]
MGLPVHHSSNYCRWLLNRLHQRQGAHVVTLNAEMCVQAEQDADLSQIIRQAELVIPDGAGIELYFRWFERQQIKRCPGIELAADLLSQLSSTDKVVFYGGAPGVTETAARNWQLKAPPLKVAIAQHGFLSEVEQQTFQTALQQLQPQVIFVGLGVPRQEFWIAAHRHLCPEAVWIGVGGSFDIWAGLKTRAPRWFCDNHLEWLYRLYKEPWRWRRMLALPKFAWRAAMHRWQKG